MKKCWTTGFLAKFSYLQEEKFILHQIIDTGHSIYANSSSHIIVLPSGANHFNLTVNLAYELTNSTVLVTFAIPNDKFDKNYEKILFKSSFNVCKLFLGNSGNFLGKAIMDILQNFADFPLVCPVKQVKDNFTVFSLRKLLKLTFKGTLHVFNIVIDGKYIPTQLLPYDQKFMLFAKVYGKVPVTKNNVFLFSLKVFGELKKF